jgi:hypothetical protein
LDEHPAHRDRRSQINALVDLQQREAVLPHSIFITGLRFESETAIGRGTFAEVFRGFYGDQVVALKRFFLSASGESINSGKVYKARRLFKPTANGSCMQYSDFAGKLLSGVS